MKKFSRVTSTIQTITRSLRRPPLQHASCPRQTILNRRMALLLLLLSVAVLVQPCAAAPFEWQFTGSMNHPRAYHTATNTATLLYDGRVLVAGGAGPRLGTFPYPGLASAEIYNPATASWT